MIKLSKDLQLVYDRMKETKEFKRSDIRHAIEFKIYDIWLKVKRVLSGK